MIKRLPGWVNYLLLFAFYSAAGFLLRWLSDAQCDTAFMLLVMAVWAGGYLAKWRFHNDDLRFW